MNLNNLLNGVEFKMKMYRSSDVDKYNLRLGQTNELAEDLGVDMPIDDVELPECVIGKAKFDPTRIIYYVQGFSAESSKHSKPKLDAVIFKYKVSEDFIEDITVSHTYTEFENILKEWYKNNNNDGKNNRVAS